VHDEAHDAGRLRVLFVTFEPGMGGPQRWLEDVLRDVSFRAAIDARVWHVEDHYRGALGKMRLLRECARQLHVHRPQRVYLSHDLNVAALVACGFGLLGAPCILVHSHNARFYANESHWKPRLYRSLVRRFSHKRIAFSHESAIAMFGEAPGQWIQLAAFIDFKKLWSESDRPPERKPRTDVYTFGCVGRLCHQKNQELAIRAMAAIRTNEFTSRLLLLGEGPLEPAYRALVQQLGIGNEVEFIGNVENVGAYYRHVLDAMLVPSRFEGQARIVAEAQLFGVPVIGAPAIPEMAYLRTQDRIRMPDLDVGGWSKAMLDLAARGADKTKNNLEAACRHDILSMHAGVRKLISVLSE